MLTVSQLARLCGLSRTTLLYYESIGLLPPASRSNANYRRYSAEDLERLVVRRASLVNEIVDALLPGYQFFPLLKC